MPRPAAHKLGLSLLELMGVLTILALLSTIGCPRLTGGQAESKSAACQTQKGDIEVQVELWRHNTGGLPETNLSNIGADVNYFPSGVPTCPVDGSAYTIDATGRVVGHNH